MKVVRRFFLIACAAAVASCSHPPGDEANSSGDGKAVASAQVSGPKSPDAAADENTWGNYLSEQGKIHAKDVQGHPYIYVVPRGDSIESTHRRMNELDSIVQSLGRIVIPGSLLTIGGPDAAKTNAFVSDLGEELKPHSLQGVTVLVVGGQGGAAAAKQALKISDADVRFVEM